MSKRELYALDGVLRPADIKAIAAALKHEFVDAFGDLKETAKDLRLCCDTLSEQLAAVDKKIENVRSEMKEDVAGLEARVKCIEPVLRRMDDVEARVLVLPGQISRAEEMVEAWLIRKQVIVYGLPEEGNEDAKEMEIRRATTESVASNFVANVMECEGQVPIEDAFRLGATPGDEPRPLVIDFCQRRDAIAVLLKKRKEGMMSKLRAKGIKVWARQTKGVRERKKLIQNSPGFKEATDAASRDGKVVYWRQDRPYIDGVLWRASPELLGPPPDPPLGARARAGGHGVVGQNGQNSGGRGGRYGGDRGGRGQGRWGGSRW